MDGPLNRAVVASPITSLDVVLFAYDSTLLPGVEPQWKVVLYVTLLLWTASTAALWLHVYFDLRWALANRLDSRHKLPSRLRWQLRKGINV